MEDEVKEVSKPTVGALLEIPKSLHRKAMKCHEKNPRSWKFKDTLIDLIRKGIESEKTSNQ